MAAWSGGIELRRIGALAYVADVRSRDPARR